MEEADIMGAAGERRASAKCGRTGVLAGRVVVAARRWRRVETVGGGGVADLQHEGDRGQGPAQVNTSKGGDRRVRLSMPTAIQFYDLKDCLGFDQPSKAVEWLINAASAAIDELPSLDPAAFAAMPDGQQQAGPRAGKRQQ